jgi:hypothetical protein
LEDRVGWHLPFTAPGDYVRLHEVRDAVICSGTVTWPVRPAGTSHHDCGVDQLHRTPTELRNNTSGGVTPPVRRVALRVGPHPGAARAGLPGLILKTGSCTLTTSDN